MSNIERNNRENVNDETNNYKSQQTRYNHNYIRNPNYRPNKNDKRTRNIIIYSIIGFYIFIFLLSMLMGIIVYIANQSQFSP